ncbi:MAG TPA: hypothetical protein VGL57_06220 [Solirubrobacteraceae bacterium]
MAATAIIVALAPPSLAQAEACPNEALRTGFSAHLPDCRVYEMVSPVFKDGYGVGKIAAVSPNGESVVFYSPGTFAGAPLGLTGNLLADDYIARRTAAGWSTTSLLPPASLVSDIYDGIQEVSPSLESELILGRPGSSFENAQQEGVQDDFFFHSTSGPDSLTSWEVEGPPLEAVNKTPPDSLLSAGASANLCHFIFKTITDEQLLSGPAGALLPHLYEMGPGCDGEPAPLRFVGLNNSGELISPDCGELLGQNGIGTIGQGSAFNAVPANGREVFFTTNVDSDCNENHFQLFVRLDGSRTLEVSRPLQPACEEVPCGGSAVAAARASGEFVGASRDGSRVFFTTRAPLVEGDKDEGNDLYLARIGCPSGEGEACEPAETQNTKVTSLVQVSHDAHLGEAAEVQGVVAIAPDGSRVYFVAQGLLGEATNAAGRAPVRGADNLYVYDAQTDRTAFIADLCSGPEASGVSEDVSCPANLKEGFQRNDASLWGGGGGGHAAQTAGADGGVLVFSSFGQLVAGDTDNAKDVYRYDAEAGALERVSTGENGNQANGNCDDGEGETNCDASIEGTEWSGEVNKQYELGDRAVSEDGSRIVFTTTEPLSPNATNGLQNVYEWHQESGQGEAAVSLISSGSATQAVEDAVISPEGKDILFLTSQGLVSQDADGAPDVYDARVDGGFLAAAAPAQECSGDACQGSLTNPAPLLVPGSVSQAPGENLPALTPAPTVAKAKSKPRRTTCNKGYVKKKTKCVKKAKAKRTNHKGSK